MLIKFMTVSKAATTFFFFCCILGKIYAIDVNRWLFQFSFIHRFDYWGNFLQTADPFQWGRVQTSNMLDCRDWGYLGWGGQFSAVMPSNISGLGLKYLYHTQMMILCHTPCHQPHSNPSGTSVPMGNSSTRPPGRT